MLTPVGITRLGPGLLILSFAVFIAAVVVQARTDAAFKPTEARQSG